MVLYVCVQVHVPMHACRNERTVSGALFYHSLPYSFETVSLIKPELDWQPTSPIHSRLSSPSLGSQALSMITVSFINGFSGFELKSSHLHHKFTYPAPPAVSPVSVNTVLNFCALPNIRLCIHSTLTPPMCDPQLLRVSPLPKN